MCMITYIPQGIDTPYAAIENGAKRNKDGHGWAVASSRGLAVGKSMEFDEAIYGLAQAREEHPGGAAIFHSRWATHGTYGVLNVHPFHAGPNSVMAHNGVLPREFIPAGDDWRSDTRIFVDRVGKFYSQNPNGVPSRRAARALSNLIGSANKLVFLAATDKGPRVRIINSQAGVWDGGVWYSNTGYKRPTYTGTTYTQSAPRTLGAITTGREYILTDDDAPYCGYSARGTYGDQLFSERNGVIEPYSPSGGDRWENNRWPSPVQFCDRCGSINIDDLAQVCLSCQYCLDCQNDLWRCTCFSNAEEWLRNQRSN